MPNNPLYHHLDSDGEHKVYTASLDQKNFIKLRLPPINERNNKITLNEVQCSIQEHHLSIYENYTRKKNNIFSPIHYTITLSSIDKKRIKAHVYFDEGGNYLSCIAKHLDPNSPISLSEADNESLRRIAELHSRAEIDSQMKSLTEKQASMKEKKDVCLKELEEKSKKGKAHKGYQSQLEKTIKSLQEEAKYLFNPDLSVIRFLEKHRENSHESNTSSGPRKKKKQNRNKQTIPEMKDTALEQLNPHNEPVCVSEKKKPVANETLPDLPLTFSQTYNLEIQQAKAKLYRDLENCTFEEGLKIFEEIDNLDQEIVEVLYQACIDGDLKLVKAHFDNEKIKTDLDSLKMLSICIYYDRQELFEYIYNNIKNHWVKHTLFVHLSEESNAYSLLELAFERRNLQFFKLLLTKFHYNPDLIYVERGSLLSKAIWAEENEYVAALLQAGANPDAIGVNKNLSFICGMIKDEKLLQFEKMGSKEAEEAEEKIMCNRTPLHNAIIGRNVAAVELLLSSKADVHRKGDNGLNALSYAVLTQFGAESIPVNKDILTILISHGFNIDERQIENSVTGLFLACENNDLESVKIFLECKADHSAKHQKKIERNKKEVGSISATPLLIALFEGHIKVANYLLEKCEFSIEELDHCYEQLEKYKKNTTVTLKKVYLKKCLEEAIRLHKAGKNRELNINEKNESLSNAKKYYYKALELTNELETKHQIYYNLGTCLLEKGEPTKEIISCFEQCLSIRRTLAKDPAKKTKELEESIDKVVKKIEELDLGTTPSLSEKTSSYASTGTLGIFSPEKKKDPMDLNNQEKNVETIQPKWH